MVWARVKLYVVVLGGLMMLFSAFQLGRGTKTTKEDARIQELEVEKALLDAEIKTLENEIEQHEQNQNELQELLFEKHDFIDNASRAELDSLRARFRAGKSLVFDGPRRGRILPDSRRVGSATAGH